LASGSYIGLRQGGTDGPEIITAQVKCDSDLSAQCTSAPVYVQVFTVAGATVGCSAPVSRLDKLPGWPNVTVSESELRTCP
jgi:hypothetical protein